MTAQIPSSCMANKKAMWNKTMCPNHGSRMIVIDNKAYTICDDCWDWATRIRQLHIKTKKEKGGK